jgi:hypothetical protein
MVNASVYLEPRDEIGPMLTGTSVRRAGSRSTRRMKSALVTRMFTNYHFVNMPLSHKHLKLDQAKIDKARRLLGLATEQETLDRALDLIIAEEPILRAHRKVKGSGGVVDIFGHQ